MTSRMLLASGPLVTMMLAAALQGCPPPPAPPPPPPTNQLDAAPPGPDPAPSFPLHGFFDLHTHPLSSLGFAGKLVYGGIDSAPAGGALLPSDPDCNHLVRAKSVAQALGHDASTHGSWGLDLNPADFFDGKFGVQNSCGDAIRQLVIGAVQAVNGASNPSADASGYPNFPDWPVWNDITHQAMYVEWIQRAHQHGLNVMVALTVNNKTLADSVAGPGDGPDDDKASSALQIDEIKGLASRHSDWMEIAYSADDLARIVTAGKLALILGLEVDDIGDLNQNQSLTIADVRAEVADLYAKGVRYLFPIHMIDNPFGTSAAYGDIFNLSNLREAGHFWNLVCAQPADGIGYRYQLGNPLTQTVELNPPSGLTVEMAGLMVAKLGMLGDAVDPPTVPTCPEGIGMVNSPGLTDLGRPAIQEMMRQGMMIDVDHMSQASVNDALLIAEVERFPVNSGHNTVRRGTNSNERSLTALQYQRIGKLHGMAGVGGANTDDQGWLAFYQDIAAQLGRTDGIGFGTDASGVSPLMAPPKAPRFAYSDDFPISSLGPTSWDYNTKGVAHYGLIADFVHGFSAVPGGADVATKLQTGAQFFYDTWRLVEQYRDAHHPDAGTAVAAAVLSPAAAAVAPATARAGKPACPSGRVPDAWGTCIRSGASPNKGQEAPAPFDATHGRATLTPGAYTLGLAVSGASTAPDQAAFDVTIAVRDRRITLGGRGAGKASGGFRKKRFVMRIDAGDHVLLLNGVAPEAGTLKGLDGSFVAHTPGKSAVTGTFVLHATADLPRPPRGTRPYGDLATYLSSLHLLHP